MDKKKIALLLLINLIIAFGFFIKNYNANALELSSDLINIIPICKKIDNPDLYQKDMFLSDLKDVKYYTPFYVQSLRFFAKIYDGDYLKGINLMSLITHLVYGILWFFVFFTLKKDYWLALIMSIFFRGIIWPPGMELLGISDLWTIMPRTIYIALLPIPFLIFVYFKKYNAFFAAFALGLILNFHPISGIGGIVLCFSIYILKLFYARELFYKDSFKKLILLILFCFLGMLPYLYVYLVNIKTSINFDIELFSQAFSKRISEIFLNPLLFIKEWNRPILYFFLFFSCLYFFLDQSLKKINFKILFLTIIIIFISANSFYFIENLLNSTFHKNIRMSFQLIRYQKLIIVLLQIGFYLFLVELAIKYRISAKLKKSAFILFVFLMVFSTQFPFSKIPIVSDDIMCEILPNNLKINLEKRKEINKDDIELMEFIKKNTDKNALFYGSFFVRVAADRSVTLDGKGAGMLIEGNPTKLIQWYKDSEYLKALNEKQKIEFLRSKNVDYIYDAKEWSSLKPYKQFGDLKLYKL